uniref:Uncharacterized protein n=1 Tax=Graphocephala atropunctata TaxID=36148 RepID=A0A1B6KZM8_9HEMI
MFKKTTANQHNSKGRKERSTRKSDKDIHLNVVGVPANNVSVNKTAHGQRDEDYHLFKISIDTNKKERLKEKKRASEPVKTSKPLSKIQQRQSPHSSLESYFASIESDHPKVDHTRKHPPRLRDQEQDDASDICFNPLEDGNRNVRIVGESSQKRGSMSSTEEPSSYSSKPKQVGFAELDTVYGSVSSVDSRDSYPYRHASPNVYQMENKETEGPFLRGPMKINNVFPDWAPEMGDDKPSKQTPSPPVRNIESNIRPDQNTLPTYPVSQSPRAVDSSTLKDYEDAGYVKSKDNAKPVRTGRKTSSIEEEDNAESTNTSQSSSKAEAKKPQGGNNDLVLKEPLRTDLWRGKPLFEGSIGSSSLFVISPQNLQPGSSGPHTPSSPYSIHDENKRFPKEKYATPIPSKIQTMPSTTPPFSIQDLPRNTPIGGIKSPTTTPTVFYDNSTPTSVDSVPRERNATPKSSKAQPVISTIQPLSVQASSKIKGPIEVFAVNKTPTGFSYEPSSSSRDPKSLDGKEGNQTLRSSKAQAASLPNQPSFTKEVATSPRISNDYTADSENTPIKTSINVKEPFSTEKLKSSKPLNELKGETKKVNMSTSTSTTNIVTTKKSNNVTSHNHPSSIRTGPKQQLSIELDRLSQSAKPHDITIRDPIEDTMSTNTESIILTATKTGISDMSDRNTTPDVILRSDVSQMSRKDKLEEGIQPETVFQSNKNPLTIDREIMTEKTSYLSKASTPKERSKSSRLFGVIPQRSSKGSNKNKESNLEKKQNIKNPPIVSSIPKPTGLKQSKLSSPTGKRDAQTDISQLSSSAIEPKEHPVWSARLNNSLSMQPTPNKGSDSSAPLKRELPTMTSSNQRNKSEREDDKGIPSYQTGKYLPTGLSNDPSIEISTKTYGEEADGVSRKSIEITSNKVDSSNTQSPMNKTLTYDDKLEEFLDKLGGKSRQRIESMQSNKFNVAPLLSKRTLSNEQPSPKDNGKSELEVVSVASEQVNEPTQNTYYENIVPKSAQAPLQLQQLNPSDHSSKILLASDQSSYSSSRKRKGDKVTRNLPHIETIQEEETPDKKEQRDLDQSIIFPRVDAVKLQNVPSRTRYNGYRVENSDLHNKDYFDKGLEQVNRNEIFAYPGRVDGHTPFVYEYSEDGKQNIESTDPKTLSSNLSLERRRPEIPQLGAEQMADKDLYPTTHEYIKNNDKVPDPEMQDRIQGYQEKHLVRQSTNSPDVVQSQWSNSSSEHTPDGVNEQHDKDGTSSRKNKRKRNYKELQLQNDRKENTDIKITEKGKHIGASLSQDHGFFAQGPQEQIIYVGEVPNTTYHVFFTPETNNEKKLNSAPEEVNESKKRKRSKTPQELKNSKFFTNPKGMIIFVNKKHDPYKDSFEGVSGYDSRMVVDSSSPKHDQGKKRKRKSASTLGSKGSRGRRNESATHSHGVPTRQEQLIGRGPSVAQAGGDKSVMIEKSPSGNKITQKYVCGCLRIITRDADLELQSEELISAFCRNGSKCEVSHPELQRYNKVIQIRPSSVRKIGPIPEIEVIADGIISRKEIQPKSPAPTMKGANFTGSLSIKSNKLNGVCHFYFDPRLKQYLRNNMEGLKAFLEDDEREKQS